MNILEYEQFSRPYKRILKQILLELEFFIEDVGNINVFSITSRMKGYENANKKSQSLNMDIKDLQDIAGLRVVVGTKEEVEVLTRYFILKEYIKDVKVESQEDIIKENGYRARHIIISSEGNLLRSIYPTKIEIQLLTIFQHSFNFISRAWLYKSDNAYSEEWKNSFIEIANELQIIDNKVSHLQLEVINSSIENPNSPLNPFTYQNIVKQVFNESVSLNDSVDYCKTYIDIGVKNNNQLINHFNSTEIQDLRNDILKASSEKGKSFFKIVSEMPKYQFWDMFGLRLKVTREILNEMEDNK